MTCWMHCTEYPDYVYTKSNYFRNIGIKGHGDNEYVPSINIMLSYL